MSPVPLSLSIQEAPFSCGSSGPTGPSGTLCQPSLPLSHSPSPMPNPIMRATTAVSTRSRLESAHLSQERVNLYPSLFEVSCVIPAQVDLGCLKAPVQHQWSSIIQNKSHSSFIVGMKWKFTLEILFLKCVLLILLWMIHPCVCLFIYLWMNKWMT